MPSFAGVRAVVLAPQTDGCNPLVDKSGILPRADVVRMIGAARERVIFERPTPVFQPGLQA